MATKNQAVPTTPDPMSSALAAFSAQLAERFPDRVIKRYVLPAVVTQCREVFIRELTTTDVITAAGFADALMSGTERASVKLSDAAEERECARLAIVGLGNVVSDGTVVYLHTNTDGIPLAGINAWPKRLWDAFIRYYNDVNGLPFVEFLEGLAGARTVGAFAPPIDGTPVSADPGRQGG